MSNPFTNCASFYLQYFDEDSDKDFDKESNNFTNRSILVKSIILKIFRLVHREFYLFKLLLSETLGRN